MSKYTGTEVVDIAKQLEAAGEAFYEAAARQVKDSEVKALFTKLRDDEKRHGEKFESLLERLGGAHGEWRQDDEYLGYLRALADSRVFPSAEDARSAVKGIETRDDALHLALTFEKDTILLLHELRDATRAETREIVDWLLAEERFHVRALTAMLTGRPFDFSTTGQTPP